MTPAEAAGAFRKLRNEIDRPIVNGLRRWLTGVRKKALVSFQLRGLGRSVFGKSKLSAIRAIIKRDRVKRAGDSFVTGLHMGGMAALQEMGGRTRAHPIRARRAGVLALKGGGFVSTKHKPLQHPGSQVRRIPFLLPAAESLRGTLPAEIDRGIQKTANQVIG